MTTLVPKQQLKLTINYTAAANMKEAVLKQKQHAVVMEQVVVMAIIPEWQRKIAAKMANAVKKVMMVRIAVRKTAKRWIAVKMVNAPKRAMMVKTVAKNQTN